MTLNLVMERNPFNYQREMLSSSKRIVNGKLGLLKKYLMIIWSLLITYATLQRKESLKQPILES